MSKRLDFRIFQNIFPSLAQTPFAGHGGRLPDRLPGRVDDYGNKIEDPADAYRAALERALRGRSCTVEVVNAGCPGWSSLQSLINLQIRVMELPPDLVIVYHGVNDVHPRLVWPSLSHRRDQSGHLTLSLSRPRFWEESSVLRTVAVAAGWIEPPASLTRLLGEAPATSFSLEFWRQTRHGVYPTGKFTRVPVARMLATNKPIHLEANLRDQGGRKDLSLFP